MRRAVVSISSNIAEGCGRGGDKEIIRFFNIAMGSVSEVRSQLYIAREFEYIDDLGLERLNNELIEIGKMLMGFIGYISRSD